nr:uncharacterized protein LOC109155335 [Ipomoea batatas]
MYSCAEEQPEPEVEARGQQDVDDGDAWEYELTPEEAARFGSLTTRCLARVLVKARKKFSRRQQGAVRALGFGKLLDLEVVQTPGRMGRWLLENFDPETMSLRLGNGVSLPIQEEDVEATLGLPRGRVTITKRDGCEWFKRHFTTLMVTTLIECMNNGYAYQMITNEFEEVEKIGELNWCKFLLDSLVETRAAWLKYPRQRYIGPILFLTVFYVDRVSFGARSVARSVPAIFGWTRKLLCGREFAKIRGGGFGLGTVELRLCDVVVDGALGGGNGGAGDGGEDAHSDGPNDADLSKVLREAFSPGLDVQADNLVQVLAASRLLLRFGPLTTGHSMPTQDPSQSLFTTSQDAFWAEPVNLRALEEIERAVEERNAFQDMPSFSLGMTQELATQQWDDVVDVAWQNDSGVGAGDVARGCPPCAPVAASPCNTPLQHATVIQNVVREVIVRPGVGVIGEDVYPMVCDPQFVTPKEPILPRAEVLSSQLRAPALAAPFKMMRPQGGGGLVQGGTSLMSRYLPPTPEEHDFYSWIVDNRHAHVHEELFNYNGWAATRDDLLSLKIGSQLRVAVIDVWSCILNLNTVVCRSAPRARRLEWFSKSMEGGLKLSPYGGWRNINMFIFPILQNEHYYVISFDMVRKRIDIIDNISVTMTNVAKYGSIPEVLRDFVSVFLDDMVDERYGFAVRRITPRRMQMH